VSSELIKKLISVLFTLRIFGYDAVLLQLTRPILVDRVSSDSRKNTIDAIKEVASERDVFIFPEGTCTNRTSLINFKCGAFLPGLPVQPIALDYHTTPGN
jgi:1-acyl-sn-glycerol-3-phosphate acyltransferase